MTYEAIAFWLIILIGVGSFLGAVISLMRAAARSDLPEPIEHGFPDPSPTVEHFAREVH